MASDTFIEDIVIHTTEGKSKLLKKEAIDGLPDIPDELQPVVNTLLQRGVIVAAIPSNPGIGSACYLLNLSSIVKPGTSEEAVSDDDAASGEK